MNTDTELKALFRQRVAGRWADLIRRGHAPAPSDINAAVDGYVESTFPDLSRAELQNLSLEVATDKAVEAAVNRMGAGPPNVASFEGKPFQWETIKPLVEQAASWTNANPVVLKFNSGGGFVEAGRKLHHALTRNNRRKLIVVATGPCASAGAEFVAQSDWAIAMPDASLLFHSARTSEGGDLVASDEDLPDTHGLSLEQFSNLVGGVNENAATLLVRKARARFTKHAAHFGSNTFQAIEKFIRLCFPGEVKRGLLGVLERAKATTDPADELLRFLTCFANEITSHEEGVRLSARQAFLLGVCDELVTG